MRDRYILKKLKSNNGYNYFFDKKLDNKMINKVLIDLKNGLTMFDIEDKYKEIIFELKVVDPKIERVGYFDFLFLKNVNNPQHMRSQAA